MNVKKILIVLFAITILLLFFGCSNSSEVETPTETVIIPVPETSSQVETESTIETEPADDYIFYDIPLDLDTQKEILKICSEYGFSYELILGMISVESSFRPKVVGDTGRTFGLMQIQPRWWSETMEREGVTDLLDPLQNVRCGCAILRELKDKYGTEYRALQAFNTGRPDTKNGYAERVYKHVGQLQKIEEGFYESN